MLNTAGINPTRIGRSTSYGNDFANKFFLLPLTLVSFSNSILMSHSYSLRSNADEFLRVVKSIEENERCEMLRMDSFLMLPMQRITRLPLLVNAVIQRTQHVKEKTHCEDALQSLTNVSVMKINI